MSSSEQTVALRLGGRVQGVGFRAFVRHHALEKGMRGYVRNLPDGRVEVVAVGADDRLQAFLDKVRIGPWGAKVETEEAFDPDPAQEFRAFDVRF